MDGVIKRKQSGLTLIELMVAAAIALLILLIITSAFLGGLRTQSAQTDEVRVNESGRFAFDVLTRELRQAGFANNWQVGAAALASLCDAQPNNRILGVNDPTSIDPSSATLAGTITTIYSPGGTSHSDVLRVRYYGEDTSGNAPTMFDCHGYPVAAAQLVTDTLYVAADAANNGEPTLYCHTTNPTPATGTHPGSMPMVAGVESLQLLYGEITNGWPPLPAFAIHYVPWQGVADPNHIVAVKASLVVRGPTAGIAAANGVIDPWPHFSSSYPALANQDSSAIFPAPNTPIPADNRLRKMMATEIALRSRCNS